ncbi:MAG: heme exporter protein CcmB [Gammaproteobacteria bacterium]|nr:heme exporter protein CcmB [Gammaproteobacteria bacterium]
MFTAFLTVLKRDLILAMRRKSDVTSTLFFFVVVVSLFPLAIGPELDTLRMIAPGIVWVAALLASMLALDHMFSVDYQDGSLEQLLLTPQPLTVLVVAKVLAHWLITGLPLVMIAPLLGVQYDLSSEAIKVLLITLLVGTPALSLIGAIGAALTLGLRGGGVLVSLLVLPLTIPVLIFGAGAVEANVSGLGSEGHLSMLLAILVMSLLLAPLATAVALRISTE